MLGTVLSIVFLADDDVRRIGEIPSTLPDLQLPVFTAAQWKLMVVNAAALACEDPDYARSWLGEDPA